MISLFQNQRKYKRKKNEHVINDSKDRLIDCYDISNEPLNSLSWSPDSRVIAVGSSDSTVRIVDTFNGSEKFCLYGHVEPVLSVSFNNDGCRLASGSTDRTIRIWNAKDGTEIESLHLRGHTASINSVSFSTDGHYLASGSRDQTIRIWVLEKGAEIQKLEGHCSNIWSVNFRSKHYHLASSSDFQTIFIWDIKKGSVMQRLDGHSGAVKSVCYSPNGYILASGSIDKTIRIWDLDTGNQLNKLIGHNDDILSVSFSPNGKFIASGSKDKSIRVWESETGNELCNFLLQNGSVESVAFSPDCQRLASVSRDGTLSIWDMKGLIQSLNSSNRIETPLTQWLSRQSATLGFRSIQTNAASPDYWVPDNLPGGDCGSCIGELRPKVLDQFPCKIALSPDGKLLYTVHTLGEVSAWDLRSGTTFWSKVYMSLIDGIDISPDGQYLVYCCDAEICITDSNTGCELRRLVGHSAHVSSVSFSSDSQRLASSSYDRTIRIWDPKIGIELRRLEGHNDWVFLVSFSPIGRVLASVSYDKTIRIWNINNGNEICRLVGHSHNVSSISFSIDGLYLASGSLDKTICIWDLKHGTELRRIEGHSNFVRSVSFSVNSQRLASVSDDQTIRIWDSETGTELNRFFFQEEYITNIAWAPNGQFLVSAINDGRVRIWDTRTQEMLKKFPPLVPHRPKSIKRKPPIRFVSVIKTWSILHRMSIDLPLSLISDLNALLGYETPDSLKALNVHQFICRLIALCWPISSRTALIALLLNEWYCGIEWQPPKGIDIFTLCQKLTEALSVERCQPEPPAPPIEFIKKSADKIDDRMITLLRALGPKAVASDPGLPLRLRHEVGKIPILSEPHRRLLSTHIIPMSSGTAQGSGAGIDRSGYARSGPLTALLPSQFALPEDILLWRYLNGGLLYRARNGQEPPQLRPVVIVLDTSPATLGPIGMLIRPAALALATTLSQKQVPSIFLSAGDEKVFFLQTPADRLKLLTHKHGNLGDPVKSIQKAEKLLDSLRNEHPLNPVILLLTHSFWGAEFEDAPKFNRLRGLFIHYPNSNPNPPWAQWHSDKEMNTT